MNYVLKNRSALASKHYIRKADPGCDYWFDFSKTKLNQYIEKHGEDFCLIILGAPGVSDDFYTIPYQKVKHMLTETTLSNDVRGRVRWVGIVIDHWLHISNCKEALYIGGFWGCKEF